MKFVFSIAVLLWAIPVVSMKKTEKTVAHHEAIRQDRDTAFCPYGEWGSSDAEPLDAVIPKEWNRSVTCYPKSEQEKLKEAIQLMQARSNKVNRHFPTECCHECLNRIPVVASVTCLSALLYFCVFKDNK